MLLYVDEIKNSPVLGPFGGSDLLYNGLILIIKETLCKNPRYYTVGFWWSFLSLIYCWGEKKWEGPNICRKGSGPLSSHSDVNNLNTGAE